MWGFCALFYIQMHSIFYITWYCNKHLQKGLIFFFLFPAVGICFGPSAFVCCFGFWFVKKILFKCVFECRRSRARVNLVDICLQASSRVPQMIQLWSSRRSRLSACARSSCRALASSILRASSAASPLSSCPTHTPGSWRACWRPRPPSPSTRAALLTCTPCWRTSPSLPAASRSCNSSGSEPTTPRPRGRGDGPWEPWGSTAWGESFLFLALSGMERRRATVSRL